MEFLPCPSSEGLLRDLRFSPSAKKKKKSTETLWKVVQCGISQTPNSALAVPGFLGVKGYGRPYKVSQPKLSMTLLVFLMFSKGVGKV